MKLRKLFFAAAVSLSTAWVAEAQQPYGGCWHPDDIKDWSPETDTDAKFNRSRVPLANRFIEPELMKANAHQFYEGQVCNATILFNTCSACPSQGANNFVGYQPTYWQYMDKLVYWAGSASEGIIIPPPAPSIDAAHQAGVKVLGQIFFPPSAFGGEGKWVSQMLTRENGEFIYARKLYEIAKYLGFDGWFINEETWGGGSAEWIDFIKQFNAIADANGDTWFEIQWYNASTSPAVNILKTHKNTSQFLEYGSVGSNLGYASQLGCTPEETFSKLYSGIQCVQAGLTGYNSSLNFAFPTDGHVGSIDLFCPEERAWKDCVKDLLGTPDACGDEAYYAIRRVFENEQDVWVNEKGDPSDISDKYWRGISGCVLERSVINSMPFVSNMCVGVGKHRFVDGEIMNTQDWYHSGVQSILPTWRWWIENKGDIKVTVDWDDAYNYGSSFKIAGNLNGEALMRLYKTMIPVDNGGVARVVFKGGETPELKLSTTSSVNPDVTLTAKTTEKNGWTVAEYDLTTLKGKTIYMIALNLKGSGAMNMNLGQISVLPEGYAPASTAIENLELQANLGEEKGDIRVIWDFDWSNDLDHFDIYTKDSTGKRILRGQTRGEAFYIDRIYRNGIDATIDVEVVPVMKDMTAGTPAIKQAAYPEATAPVVTFKLSKSYLKIGETATVTAMGTGAPESWSWILPEGLELAGGELTDQTITVKATKEGRQSVTVKATNVIGTSETTREIIDVYTEDNYSLVHNVVLNKTVVAYSSSANAQEVPTRIINGVRNPISTSAKWCCTTPNNWVIFDCEAVFRIYGFGIWDCNSGPERAENFGKYTIEVSMDGENWNMVVNEEGRGSDDVKLDNISPVRGRYVRLSPKNEAVMRIWEFEVYGALDANMTSTVTPTELRIDGGNTRELTVSYDFGGSDRVAGFTCKAVASNPIVEIGEITEDIASQTFTIPVTALETLGETEITITVDNGGDYSENKVHVTVDSDIYPNVLEGKQGIMRHYKSDWSGVAEFDVYDTMSLTDGDTSTDACADIPNFSTHKDDFWAIFEAEKFYTLYKVKVFIPNSNKGTNDNGKDGLVNNEISIAVGNNLSDMERVKTFSDLGEISELEYILPTEKKVNYIAIICNLNAYFYPSLAEVEAYGIDEAKLEEGMVHEPVVISNWKQDIIAEARTSAEHTDFTLDDQGWVLYTSGIQENGSLCGDDGILVSNNDTKFQFAPFDQPNALVLKSRYEDFTLELATPSYNKELQFLLISANGSSSLNVTVNYDDNTKSTTESYSIPDWFGNNSNAARTGLGRIITQRSGSQYNADQIDINLQFQLFERTIATDITKKVKSVKFESAKYGSYPTILAISRFGNKIEDEAGVDNVTADSDKTVTGYYNLQGIEVKNPSTGIYIVRYSDGTVAKVAIK